MKRKRKSKEALLALFKREGYEEVGDYFVKGHAIWFNKNMFELCGEEVSVIEHGGGVYDYRDNYNVFREEWLEPIEEPMKVMVLPEKMLRRALRLNGYRKNYEGDYMQPCKIGVNYRIFERCETEIEITFRDGKIYDKNNDDWDTWFFVPISLRRAEVQQ